MERRNRSLAALYAVAFGAVAQVAAAQTGAIIGTVARDTLGHGIGDAEVSLPALGRGTRTNYLGEFRFDHIPAGRYAIIIRRVGFAPFSDSVSVKDGPPVDAEFVLTPSVVQLDPQKVVASGVDLTAPYMREFDERRKTGFGHFFTTDELRKIEGGRPLMNYLASRLPGMSLYRPDPKERPTDYYIGSNRGSGHGNRCPVALYIDGVAMYVPGVTVGRGNPPDVSQLSADDFAAVEYYAGGATAPAQFNTTQANCGILLLWRRYKG